MVKPAGRLALLLFASSSVLERIFAWQCARIAASPRNVAEDEFAPAPIAGDAPGNGVAKDSGATGNLEEMKAARPRQSVTEALFTD